MNIYFVGAACFMLGNLCSVLLQLLYKLMISRILKASD